MKMQIIPSAIDGEIFEYQDTFGTVRRFRLNIEQDDDTSPPWERSEGHGIVSEWTSRDKRPGERVLSSDRGQKRFYDVAESTRIARRDGWNATPYDGTKGEQAARAVDSDFEYLRKWCADQWTYVGVIVTPLSDDDVADDDTPTDYTYALWGIESEDSDYIKDTALELAYEASRVLNTEETESAHWAQRDTVTR